MTAGKKKGEKMAIGKREKVRKARVKGALGFCPQLLSRMPKLRVIS